MLSRRWLTQNELKGISEDLFASYCFVWVVFCCCLLVFRLYIMVLDFVEWGLCVFLMLFLFLLIDFFHLFFSKEKNKVWSWVGCFMSHDLLVHTI